MSEDALAALLPEGAVLVVADERLRAAPLAPGDQVHVAGAVPRRRREFAVGRACAREALGQIGFPGNVGRSGDRCPTWPEGVVGSIAHCEGFCAAAVAPASRFAGIGIDAEPLRRLDEGVARIVCTPAERAAHGSLERLPGGADPALLAFCAKEAFYKAWYPTFRRVLRFHEVHVALGHGLSFAAIGAAGVRVRGRFFVDGALVVAGCAPRRAAFA